MIRINLLGVPKSKRAKRQSISIGAGANYFYYYKLNSETQQLAKDLDAAKRDNGRLAGVKAKYQEREKQFQLYDRRVKVMHQLQAAQNGPSELLTTVATTVKSTDAVW